MPFDWSILKWLRSARKQSDRRHLAEMEELKRRMPRLLEEQIRRLAWIRSLGIGPQGQQAKISSEQLRRLEAEIIALLSGKRAGAGWTNTATAGVAGTLPTVLNPASRPDVFAALKEYEATAPLSVPHTSYSTSTITAWRAWRVENRMPTAQRPELRLVSVGYNMVWEPGKKHEAKCAMGTRHPAPDWGCHCGIWGFKTVEEMMRVLQQHRYRGPAVLGTISLWGKVIETEHGFRAQYAYPKELWLDEEMLELGWIYKIPIRAATMRRDPPALTNRMGNIMRPA